MGVPSLWTECDRSVKPMPLKPLTASYAMGSGLPSVNYGIFIAPSWHEDEVCMTVRQLQRHTIFMGKFTQLCDIFKKLHVSR